MKIAIVCDWLVTLGGAENFLGELFQCYPDADLFAVVDFLPDDKRDFLLQKKAKTTFIQRLPFAKSRYRSYLPLMPLAIEQLDLSAYDLIISSSHAVAKGVITGPDQLHICYTHSPMRYAWDLQHQYLRETGLDRSMKGVFARLFLHKLRLWDLRSANGVDHFIANSHYIARRIKKTYRRNADVIYSPIKTENFSPKKEKEYFYLAASRLVPYKRIDLIVESFNAMPDKKLIVIGDGPEFKKIKSIANRNIELLGYQPTSVMVDHLQRAKGFVFAAEEDFGLLPLEAQACGTPVIAFGKGGALETVRGIDQDNPTGVFFYEQTTNAIIDAINYHTKNITRFTVENCIENAARFTPPHFRDQFKTYVREKYEAFKNSKEISA